MDLIPPQVGEFINPAKWNRTVRKRSDDYLIGTCTVVEVLHHQKCESGTLITVKDATDKKKTLDSHWFS
jgi:hypothetical protein